MVTIRNDEAGKMDPPTTTKVCLSCPFFPHQLHTLQATNHDIAGMIVHFTWSDIAATHPATHSGQQSYLRYLVTTDSTDSLWPFTS
jgi:hypothetical protein